MQQIADRIAAAIARPRGGNVFEDVRFGRIAGELVEVVEERAAPLGRAKPLALVHAAALGSDLGVRTAEERIERADVDAQRFGDRRIVGLDRLKRKAIPEEALRLP